MERRNFLSLCAIGAVAGMLAPSTLSAIDFRSTKPKVWTATKIDAAITELFGAADATDSADIQISAPEIAENGAVVPISVKTSLKAKTVALFQDANPESAVIVIDMQPRSVADFDFRIKMAKSGDVVAVVNVDGKLFKAKKSVKVTMGGCGG